MSFYDALILLNILMPQTLFASSHLSYIRKLENFIPKFQRAHGVLISHPLQKFVQCLNCPWMSLRYGGCQFLVRSDCRLQYGSRLFYSRLYGKIFGKEFAPRRRLHFETERTDRRARNQEVIVLSMRQRSAGTQSRTLARTYCSNCIREFLHGASSEIR